MPRVTLEELALADDGGPAFPFSYITPHGPAVKFGMTLRDYFAAQALPGCIEVAVGIEASGGVLIAGAQVLVADMAYSVADAMLAKRKS